MRIVCDISVAPAVIFDRRMTAVTSADRVDRTNRVEGTRTRVARALL